MSFSMILGRVILPAAALILAAGIAWNSLRTITARSENAAVDASSLPVARTAGSRPRGGLLLILAPRSPSARKSWVRSSACRPGRRPS